MGCDRGGERGTEGSGRGGTAGGSTRCGEPPGLQQGWWEGGVGVEEVRRRFMAGGVIRLQQLWQEGSGNGLQEKRAVAGVAGGGVARRRGCQGPSLHHFRSVHRPRLTQSKLPTVPQSQGTTDLSCGAVAAQLCVGVSGVRELATLWLHRGMGRKGMGCKGEGRSTSVRLLPCVSLVADAHGQQQSHSMTRMTQCHTAPRHHHTTTPSSALHLASGTLPHLGLQKGINFTPRFNLERGTSAAAHDTAMQPYACIRVQCLTSCESQLKPHAPEGRCHSFFFSHVHRRAPLPTQNPHPKGTLSSFLLLT